MTQYVIENIKDFVGKSVCGFIVMQPMSIETAESLRLLLNESALSYAEGVKSDCTGFAVINNRWYDFDFITFMMYCQEHFDIEAIITNPSDTESLDLMGTVFAPDTVRSHIQSFSRKINSAANAVMAGNEFKRFMPHRNSAVYEEREQQKVGMSKERRAAEQTIRAEKVRRHEVKVAEKNRRHNLIYK